MPARLTGTGTVFDNERALAYVRYDLVEGRAPALSGTITVIDGRALPRQSAHLFLIFADRRRIEFYYDPQNPVDRGPIRIMATYGFRPKNDA